MGAVKKFTKSAIRKVGNIFPGTGRHAAKRAETAANEFVAAAEQDRAKLEEKTKKERLRAQKLAIKGLRSRRAASYFKSPTGESTTYGSPTIG